MMDYEERNREACSILADRLAVTADELHVALQRVESLEQSNAWLIDEVLRQTGQTREHLDSCMACKSVHKPLVNIRQGQEIRKRVALEQDMESTKRLMSGYAQAEEECESKLALVEQENTRLRSALEPFARFLDFVEAAKGLSDEEPLSDHDCVASYMACGGSDYIWVKNLREARAALKPETREPFAMSMDEEWLKKAAEREDGKIVSVGGLVHELSKNEELPHEST